MLSKDFEQRRRQQFLNSDMYNATKAHQEQLLKVKYENLAMTSCGMQSYTVQRAMIYLEKLWLWSLDYTAGVDISLLSDSFMETICAFEEWNEAYQDYQKNLNKKYPDEPAYEYIAAPDFSVLSDYQNFLQLLSIAILLRRRDAIARILAVMRSHRGEDKLFEELIEPYSDDEYNAKTCELGHPYSILADVFDGGDENAIIRKLKEYLIAWYPAMKKHPRWYDGHLKVSPEGWANYYGYWSFEAGAAVYLLDVKDQSIDSIVYPRDLVEYAKAAREREEEYGAFDKDYSRIEGGAICPKSGFWETPAKPNSRRFFKAGETMPTVFKSEYGATVWQWSADQNGINQENGGS